MHGESHCTLFSEDVDFLKGGHGTFYVARTDDQRVDGDDDNVSGSVSSSTNYECCCKNGRCRSGAEGENGKPAVDHKRLFGVRYCCKRKV